MERLLIPMLATICTLRESKMEDTNVASHAHTAVHSAWLPVHSCTHRINETQAFQAPPHSIFPRAFIEKLPPLSVESNSSQAKEYSIFPRATIEKLPPLSVESNSSQAKEYSIFPRAFTPKLHFGLAPSRHSRRIIPSVPPSSSRKQYAAMTCSSSSTSEKNIRFSSSGSKWWKSFPLRYQLLLRHSFATYSMHL